MLKPQVFIVLLQLIFTYTSYSLDYSESLTDPQLQERAHKLYEQTRCPTCAGQSIESSNADMAQQLRAEIRQALLSGNDNETIMRDLQNRYGPAITYDPALTLQTVILWGLPMALCIVGFGLFVRRYRQ